MAKARILAVDDQRYFRELIAGMLSGDDFEPRTAASGEEALRILDRADFDLVLADLVMPGMDGTELVQRIKERDPEQDVLVVTGVVDVETAVNAMKLGAADYLLKPFDRQTLTGAVDAILQNRRLEAEHAQLLAENIEYMGERSLYARALALVSTLEIEPLALRIADDLCRETRAQGAVVWLAGEGNAVLERAAVRGPLSAADAPESLDVAALPTPLGADEQTALLSPGDGDAPDVLWGVLRREGRVLGAVRLTDKLEGDAFDALDRSCVDRFLQFAEVAVVNARRVRALEHQGLREPVTGAHRFDYFRDVARNEIEKASRFGRRVAVLALDLGPPSELARIGGDDVTHPWLAGVSEHLRHMLRAIDVLGVDSAWRFVMLLPEADAIGAAVLKRRVLAALAGSDLFTELAADVRPTPSAGFAVYPGDAGQLDALLAVVEARIAESRANRAEALGRDRSSLASTLRALARQGAPQRAETAPQLARFLMAEVGRRPRERGILYTAPGDALASAVREGLEALRGLPLRTDLAVITDGERLEIDSPAVNWVAPRGAVDLPPCLFHYGDGPVYALVCEETRSGQRPRLFHTNDRDLVEHLAFRLQEELALPAVPSFEEGAV